MTLVKPSRLPDTLHDLANLRDDSPDIFLKKYQGYYAAEDLNALSFTTSGGFRIYEYRDSLRKIWEGDREARTDVVYAWVKQANKRGPYYVFVGSSVRGHSMFVGPNYGILPLSLALGVSELWSKMAVCENPECPNRYFLKGRKTQRFCDRPACAAYGQRQHKLKWWKENGETWKQKWLKAERSKNRKK